MNGKTALKSVFTLLATATILTPTVALANRYTDSIINQLVQAARYVGLGGYQYRDADAGTMNPRSREHLTVTLRAGTDYRFVSVCDQDCSDVDLRLYDENGRLIDADVAYDDTPVVGVTPRWTGQFTVEVSMASCRANYCYYGIGLFQR